MGTSDAPAAEDPPGRSEDGACSVQAMAFISEENSAPLATDLSACSGKSEPSASGAERGSWGSQLEFLLSCLSYAVGLGNIWRFPYLCYQNGGGAFLIPYVLMLFCTGVPLFFFELTLGQFSSRGPIAVWSICPLFQGIGYAMFFISLFIGIYYNMILAWTLFYLYSSFTDSLPWNSCDNWWNTDACRRFDARNCTLAGGLLNGTGGCVLKSKVDDGTWASLSEAAGSLKMPADEFFHNYMLNITEGIHTPGGMRWPLVLCLLVAWTLVFLVLLKGVKSFGKAVYFTATFPYLILLCLLVRAATLPGYVDGIYFYLTPRWEKLASAKVWADAAIQIFFSLSPCWGGLITLASYNKFHNNHFRDAIIISCGNCFTSFFAGFVIFGIVGFMAHELGVKVEDVVAQGPGLAFIAYPEAVSRLPVSPLWSVLFFSMLLTLGLGTQFTLLETVISTVTDLYPHRLRQHHTWVLLGSCLFMFGCGLPLCSSGGLYILTLLDSYAGTFSALTVGMAEVLVVAHIYGADRLLDDIRTMLGYYPFHYVWWKWSWKLVTPVMVTGLLLFTWIDHSPLTYGAYEFPLWATAVGWIISLTSVAMIPLVAAIKLCSMDSSLSLMQRVRRLTSPDAPWGPALPVHRTEAKMAARGTHHGSQQICNDFTLGSFSEESGEDSIPY
ncbi:sodium- and chloride-dependent glycine transporter 1-like [Pollicipes pollicipes]|uniref:sodium- and chloride-dependent glycine transporter 1-like n=1 Tax=Pollicipes pollicipes TaxID=41117 RepID=UPI0018853FD4|nr:sodium- and chloride-dependent glycine transporter 1-like [Pollicipes pollicipes]XP_037086942.1 sodium- and chloride-dependent glycine transporter 1-like [Pollicipes pollicipes]